MELAEVSKSLPPLKNEDKLIRKYNLPGRGSASPNNFKIGFDNNTGVIDTWPAHSQNQRPSNVQLTLNKHNRLVIQNAIEQGKVEMTPKPKFLENLEKFLSHELEVLGCNQPNYLPEARLQAFREVFEYLIEEFKTYRPLMSSIKNEYEVMLEFYRDKIKELEPLKGMLVTLSNECELRLMQYREEEKIEIKELKQEKKQLLEHIVHLKNEMLGLQSQVDKLKNELMLEHERYRDEHDKKKLLISDLNDLRFQQEEAKQAEKQRERKRAAELRGGDVNAVVDDSENDDPITLKLALKVCRQNLTDAMKRLTRMEADYGDVIPRRDYLALEQVFNELKEKSSAVEKENKTFKGENNKLREMCKQMEAKLQEALQEVEFMKGSNTPRPDWDKCALVVDGGAERWKELSGGKSSNQLVEVLLHEFTGSSQSGQQDFFTGLGTSDTIQFHLRFDGQLKNRHLTKRDACMVIAEIWSERNEMIQRSPNSDTMSEFLFNYYKSRFPSNQLAYEWCYNINDACERYPHNEALATFHGVLNEKIDEEIYHRERRILMQLLQHLIEVENKEGYNEDTADTLSQTSFAEALKDFFKLKSSQDIEMLVKAAREELDTKDDQRMSYKMLMSEDDEGRSGPFITTLKLQMQHERQAYVQEVKQNFAEKSSISINDFKRAIGLVDQNISDKEIDRYIKWCFSVNKDEQSLNKTMDSDELYKRLENCSIYKHESQIANKKV